MSEELTQRILKVIADSQKLPPEKVTIDSTFEELGIDSLDGVNILFALENEFNINIPDEGVQGIRSIRQMVEALDKLLAERAERDAGAGAAVSMARRVVVTGVGVISALGRNAADFWQALAAGRPGIGPMTLVDPGAAAVPEHGRGSGLRLRRVLS